MPPIMLVNANDHYPDEPNSMKPFKPVIEAIEAILRWRQARADRHRKIGPIRLIMRGVVALFLAFFVFVILLSFTIDRPPDQTSQNSNQNPRVPKAWEAHYICKEYVKDKLISPSSANFPLHPDVARDIGDGSFIIISYVESTNAFGVKIRQRYSCIVHYAGDDYWTLTTLNFHQPGMD